ncbi:hypothetical protein Aab01nite_00700 [Paractinoplanes abujensis]|uniref:Uncharacterized protein n=1 Tax=Paractinoplanes abujensis TaxID=882441 RepID=A0A7W7CRR7_9ACTN|nr:hypothetical protein [Actinoplanes abujensis]MBB4692105.1 hypothetical protein [Actinoplanes abujensis]GID16480.1 hypothetical protein Aab01nite_00700 [Actinoplanes abujensis]
MSDVQKPWLVRKGRHEQRPREVVHDLIDVAAGSAYVILWETPHGPVLYVVPLGPVGHAEHEELTRQLMTRLVAPGRHPATLILQPSTVSLDTLVLDRQTGPFVYLRPIGGRQGAAKIGRNLGADLPIWVSGTTTVETARAMLAERGRTVPVPDSTSWGRSEAMLLVGMRAGLPETHPRAWGALAREHRVVLEQVRAGHARLPDRSAGWYLAARPRPPQPPEPLRTLLDEAAFPADRGERAAAEIITLEAAARDMDRDDPRIEPFTAAASKLAFLMAQDRSSRIIGHEPPTPHLDHARAAGLIAAVAPWSGEVARTWRQTLSPVRDQPAALRRHRLTAAGKHGRPEEVYRDRAGRYVLVFGDTVWAEWPRDPAVAATWTDETILAADGPSGPLLAFTPDPGGVVRADPLPAALVDGGPMRFDDDKHVMRLLLGLALVPADAEFAARAFVFGVLTEEPGMTLWPALTARGDRLRLPWPTVRAAAAADVALARRLLAPGAPALYQYYVVTDDMTHQTVQVVRRSATAKGGERDESFTGRGWKRTLTIFDINHGHGDNYEYRRLRAEEVGPAIEAERRRRT